MIDDHSAGPIFYQDRVGRNNYARYKIAGIAVIDKEMTGKYIDGVKVVANMENAAEYVCKEWIDEVLIVTSGVVPYPKELIEQETYLR